MECRIQPTKKCLVEIFKILGRCCHHSRNGHQSFSFCFTFWAITSKQNTVDHLGNMAVTQDVGNS